MAGSTATIEPLLRELAENYRQRYGIAIFDVTPQRTNGHLELSGSVLLASQRDELLARLSALESGPIESHIRVLASPDEAPLYWAMPLPPCADVYRQPRDDDNAPAPQTAADDRLEMLSTQALPDDPPLRVLYERGAWRLVQLWDHTMGWAHVGRLQPLAGSMAPGAASGERGKRAAAGATVPVEITSEQLIAAGRALVDTPYLLGGACPQVGIDCSALVQRLYWREAGLLLPKHTGDQRRLGLRVSRADVEPGDLLFYKSRSENFSHVAMALDRGGETVLHASRSMGRVCIQSFAEVASSYAFLGARRVARMQQDRPTTEVTEEQGSFDGAARGLAATRNLSSSMLSVVTKERINLSHPPTLRGRNVHVVGFAGSEGAAIIRFLARCGVTTVTAHDFSTPEELEKNFRLAHVALKPRDRGPRFRELMGLPVEFRCRDRYLEGIDEAEVVFLPQGWFLYENNAPVRALRASGRALFSSMTDLYFRLAPCPIAAVTGTNGKSTTSRLLADIMTRSGHPTLFGGNERRSVQVLDELLEFDRNGVLVLEVSNRQLMDLEFSPHVAVVTTVTPDHIEEHGSFDKYVACKRKLVQRQTASDFAVLNIENDITWSFRADTPATVIPFGVDPARDPDDGARLVDGKLMLRRGNQQHDWGEASRLRLPGRHNIANALAAATAAHLCGADDETIRQVLGEFEGIGLRLQTVGEVNGVRWVNDVKATTPEAALAAVEAFEAPLVLIAGGGDKGLDYGTLAARLLQRARAVVLLDSAGGERVREAIEQAAREQGTNPPALVRVSDLEKAVATAASLAQPGDVALLSPACPGMFSMYMDDNKGFNTLVRSLTHKV
jgi:UDP-N-acetylmuramoylalanine--D-glutamate ligase